MSLFPLGLLSQGGGAGGVNAFQLISTTVLGTAQSSVTFSSIPSTYRSLQLRVVGRSAQAANFDSWLFRVNGDSGNNYAYKDIDFSSAATTSNQATPTSGVVAIGLHAANSATNNFGSFVVDILGNNVTTRKTSLRGFGGAASSSFGANGAASVVAGVWNNTAVVTSLTISTNSASNLIAGSRFSLYGVL